MKLWLVSHRENPNAVRVIRRVPSDPGARQFGTLAEFHLQRGRSGSYGSTREAKHFLERNKRP